MTQTLTTPPATAPTRPGRAPAPLLLTGTIAAGPVFLGAGLVQGLTRDGFDFTRNALSQLSLGPLGWIQVGFFLLAGLLTLAGAAGLRHTLRGGPGGTWGPRLIGVFGLSFLIAGLFTADPGAGFPPGTPLTGPVTLSGHGAVHMAAGMIGYLALCAAFPVLARSFAARGERGWATATRLVPVPVLVGFAASAATVAAFTAAAALGLLWLTAVSCRLRAAGQG
ncbi:DUF998 domain-containing protein [Kitasatospora sp. NPDC051853]|uniref:DUF998 domain-containing protein n=1 Tax=Kitasatospora sp. NPDC051853 TaxID=3364058 RepID=UPI0037A6E346